MERTMMVGKLLAGRTRRLCDVKNCSVLSASESRETNSHSRLGWPATVQPSKSLWRGSLATVLHPVTITSRRQRFIYSDLLQIPNYKR